jgi:Transposase DDE domain
VTQAFQESYRRWRPMVERSLAWLVANSCRRVPYRGIERNEAWWSLRVAAVNLRRLLVLGLARHDGVWVLAGPARRRPAHRLAVRSRPSTTAAVGRLPR